MLRVLDVLPSQDYFGFFDLVGDEVALGLDSVAGNFLLETVVVSAAADDAAVFILFVLAVVARPFKSLAAFATLADVI